MLFEFFFNSLVDFHFFFSYRHLCHSVRLLYAIIFCVCEHVRNANYKIHIHVYDRTRDASSITHITLLDSRYVQAMFIHVGIYRVPHELMGWLICSWNIDNPPQHSSIPIHTCVCIHLFVNINLRTN